SLSRIASGATSRLMVPASASMAMGSPSRTAAMGPPLNASGTTWATMKPCVAPLKRPSVTSATGLAPPAGDGAHGVLFAVEHARGAAVLDAFVAGELDDAAIRRERSAQNGHASARLEGLRERAHDFLSGGFARIGGFFGEGAAGAGERGAIHVAALDQALRDHADAAGLVHVDGDEASAGLQVHEH